MVVFGKAGRDRGRMPAAPRRLRLHAGISDLTDVRGRTDPEDLRRHQRDHEAVDRAVAVAPRRQRRGRGSGPLTISTGHPADTSLGLPPEPDAAVAQPSGAVGPPYAEAAARPSAAGAAGRPSGAVARPSRVEATARPFSAAEQPSAAAAPERRGLPAVVALP